jgi:adenylosuccinate lyase
MPSFEELLLNAPAGAAKSVYEHPLVQRYASKEMSYVWSPAKKFRTWRLMWIALATAEQELGLDITTEQIEDMKNQIDNIDWEFAEAKVHNLIWSLRPTQNMSTVVHTNES